MMDLAAVMDATAERLATIEDLRTFAWPPGSVTPPAAVVGYPTEYRYDQTYGRGMDRLSLPVAVVVGRPSDRSTRDALAGYVNGCGARSVKAVLESGAHTAFDTVHVRRVEFDVYTLGGTDYLAAVFDLDIAGPGTA